jgi:TonB family protein
MKYLLLIALALSFCLAVVSVPAVAKDESQTQEKIYQPNEVTVKAKILRKAQPQYTKEARRNNTSGTIVVGMVLRASGEVSDIVIIKGLPDGLNDSAVRAAQATEFEPALKDDQKVSQYIRMEYGFRIY